MASKKEKVQEINQAIKRSSWAVTKGAKAELFQDGGIEYSRKAITGMGRVYRIKISFSEMLMLLTTEDMRALKKKYGR